MTVKARLLTDWPDIEAIEPDWRALHAAAGGSLFSAFDWMSVQHAALPPEGDLRCVTLWNDGALVAAAPLMETRGRITALHKGYRGRIVAPWLCHYAGYAEVLTREPGLVAPLAREILSRFGRTTLAIDLMREGAATDALQGALSEGGRRVRRRPSESSATLPLDRSWEAYVASRSRNLRKTLRRAETALAEAGGRTEVITAPDDTAMDRAAAISRRSWKFAAGSGMAATPGNLAFARALWRRYAARGDGLMVIVTDRDGDIGHCMIFREGRQWYGIWIEFDEAKAELSPGRVSVAAALRHMMDTGEGGVMDMVRETHFTQGMADLSVPLVRLDAYAPLGLHDVLTATEAGVRRLLGNRRLRKSRSVRRAQVIDRGAS